MKNTLVAIHEISLLTAVETVVTSSRSIINITLIYAVFHTKFLTILLDNFSAKINFVSIW